MESVSGNVSSSTVETRSFNNFNVQHFCAYLKNADWKKVTQATNVDTMLNDFIDIVNEVADRSASGVNKHRISSKSPPWFSDELRKSIRERDF